MTFYITVDKSLEQRHVLMVLFKEFIRRIVNPEIAVYAFTLDVGIVEIEVNRRVSEIFHGNTISREGTGDRGELLLQFIKIYFIENNALKTVP